MTAKFTIMQSKTEFYLRLNNMRGAMEDMVHIGPFESPEQILRVYKENLVEPYFEEGSNAYGPEPKRYHKTFRSDSIFSWCNPIDRYGREGEITLEDFIIHDDSSHRSGIVCSETTISIMTGYDNSGV